MSTSTSIPISNLPDDASRTADDPNSGHATLGAPGFKTADHLIFGVGRRKVSSPISHADDPRRIHAFQPQGRGRKALPDRLNVRSPLVTEISRELDRQACALIGTRLAPSDHPFANKLLRREPTSYNRDFADHLAEQHEEGIRHMESMVHAILIGGSCDLVWIGGVVAEKLAQATEDMDAFICLGVNPSGIPYPGRHSTHTGMLAMAIGASLGLDLQSLVELGIGCWIHDFGMSHINRGSLETARVLGTLEFCEITKHPLKTFEMVADVLDRVPLASRLVAYQIHERANGSGYPRGRESAQTHPLARIAAVADTYTALVAPRPHRPGLQPYYAVEKLLSDLKLGLYDPKAVRGLLQTVGLFPIGSYVALNNANYVARVIRANGSNFARPVIEVWKRTNLGGTPGVVDLLNEDHLEIVRPLVSLRA